MIEPFDNQVFQLLADRSQWESLGGKFSGDNLRWQLEDFYGVLGLVAVFIVLMIALRIAAWNEKTAGPRVAKRRLFKALCDEHGLSKHDRKMLKIASKELELELVEELFVRPDLFARGAKTSLTGASEAEWHELGMRLFASSEETTTD